MSDVEVTASYDKMPSVFDVDGKEMIEKRNDQGKLVGGKYLRWLLESDKTNMAYKMKTGKYETYKGDDIEVPFADKRNPGEPWTMTIGREKFVLGVRSYEENEKYRKWVESKTEKRIYDSNRPQNLGGGAIGYVQTKTTTGPMPNTRMRPSITGK
jgi:hypothetical protein